MADRWIFEKSVDVVASIDDAWHFFSDLEGVDEWNEHLVGHEIVKGPPNEVGSEVVLHYLHGKISSKTTAYTRVREAPHRIVQDFESGGHEYTGTAVFEDIGDGVTRISMTMDFDLSKIARMTRPLRKASLKLMADDMFTRYSTFLIRRATDDLVSQMKGID